MDCPRKTPSHLGVPLSVQSAIGASAPVSEGPFAPGHLGELTRIVSFDLVDAALENTRSTQQRVRVLPSRVVVYLLLAAALFTEIGYRQVWARLVAGLDPATVACPGSSALSQAIRRVGVAPLRELFTLLAGPAVGAARWHGLLVCAIDGTSMFVPNSSANAATFGRQTGRPDAESGYPMLRLLTVVACGTRTVIDAVFGSYRVGETTYAPRLLRCLRPGMLLLADRNFAVTTLIEQIAEANADLLIRLLITYQALRTALSDATLARPDIRPDRLSFTVALHAARDQVVHATATIAETTVDLIGRIGAAALNQPLPARRSRSSPRVVKRAISKHRAKGDIDRTNHTTVITIEILDG